MIRIRCTATTDHKRCNRVFRARRSWVYCRECYRRIEGKNRPISSRELSENKYRRNRKRRGITARAVPKVIVNRNKQRGKNANG